MLLEVILVGLTLYGLYYLFAVKPFKHWSDRDVKHMKPMPFFGNFRQNLWQRETVFEVFQRLYHNFPGSRYTGIFQFGTPFLMLRDPDLIKQITVKDFDHFMDHRGFVPDNVDPLWSRNLLSLRGQQWRNMRTTLSPSFTASKMRTIFVLISEVSENLMKHFQNQKTDVIELELKDTFTRYTNDVIASAAFGLRCNSLDDKTNEFYIMGKELTNRTGFFNTLPFLLNLLSPALAKVLKVKIFSNRVRKFFLTLIKDTISIRKMKNIVRPDMLQLLMEARNPDAANKVFTDDDINEKVSQQELSDIDITAQALIFFFAGFDSVSSLMCFTSYELATNPDVQQKLYEEICEVRDSCDGKITYDAVMKMPYMDMVISEALRKWPPFPSIDRQVTKPYTIEPVNKDEKPVHLKTGEFIMLPIYALHMDPEHFPNPEKFDPERFNEENKNSINPYAYIPFGGGPRFCIGNRFALMEVKAVFYHLLSQFELVPTAKSIIPLKLTKRSFLTNAEGGFHFGLKRRNAVQ